MYIGDGKTASLGVTQRPPHRKNEWPVVFPAFRPFAVVVEARR